MGKPGQKPVIGDLKPKKARTLLAQFYFEGYPGDLEHALRTGEFRDTVVDCAAPKLVQDPAGNLAFIFTCVGKFFEVVRPMMEPYLTDIDPDGEPSQTVKGKSPLIVPPGFFKKD